MYDFFVQNSATLDAIIKTPNLALPHDRTESLTSKFDFEKEYVLISGSAFVARYGAEKRVEAYTELALRLKELLVEYDLSLYLLESCDGDSIMRFEVSEITGIPFIPVTTNIFLLGRILGKCRCFVSGRFHPSILASLGGTPLVLMGSDSVKIQAFPEMLKLPVDRSTIYPSVPNSEQISEIYSAVKTIIEQPLNRKPVREVCRDNGEKAKGLARAIKNALS
jgi:polysaccharide pyruvyl transferase WcaK-like protein